MEKIIFTIVNFFITIMMLLFFNIVLNSPLYFQTKQHSKDIIVKNEIITTDTLKLTAQ